MTTTFSGAVAAGLLAYAGTASDRPDYFEPGDAAAISVAISGAKVNEQPTSVAGTSHPGAKALSFIDDYYNRIHVSPTSFNVGNVVSATTRTVNVWNAHFEPVALSSISRSGVDGIDDTFATGDFAALQERSYTITAQTSGGPTINAAIDLSFDAGEESEITITGKRVIAFAFEHNWESPVVDRLEWLTNIIESYNASEQRIRLRKNPRRMVEFSHLIDGAQDLGLLDSLLYGWGGKEYSVPMWHESSSLTAAAAAADTRIDLKTTDGQFVEGDSVMLWASPSVNEVVEIAGVDSTGLDLAGGLSLDWSVGARVMPSKQCILSNSPQVQHSANTLSLVCQFGLTSPQPITAAPESLTYNGVQVLTRRHNYVDDLARRWARKFDVIDAGTGPRAWIDQSGFPYISRDLTFAMFGRTDITAFRGWLASLAGRCNAFYSQTQDTLLQIAAGRTTGQSEIEIADIGYSSLVKQGKNRSILYMLHSSGTAYIRTVTDSSKDESSGHELLELDASIPFAYVPSDWLAISYLELVRLDADAIEISYEDAANATAKLTVDGVKQ